MSTNDSLPQTLTLSRRQLTVAMLLVIFLPVGLAVVLWWATPENEEPQLVAEVSIGPASWPPGNTEQSRLLPCVTLRNPTQDLWENVSLAINSQFYFYHRDPMPGGSSIDIPLRHFQTKGNQFFVPDHHRIMTMTVYAQIPSGARAILDKKF